MAQQGLGDFFKPNQPLQLDQFAQRIFQLENVSNDFKLRCVTSGTCALDIIKNNVSAEAIINLITKTLQSWSDPKDQKFL